MANVTQRTASSAATIASLMIRRRSCGITDVVPTILSHPAAAIGFRSLAPRLRRRLFAAGVLASILPDIDVIGFRYGIPYGSTFGHRGFTHSILFAALAAAVLALVAPRGLRWRAAAFLFASAVSHGLLDACTNGGRGVAFFSPFVKRRFFFPWRPIAVSPIGRLDASVLVSELRWVWLPFLSLAIVMFVARRRQVPDG